MASPSRSPLWRQPAITELSRQSWKSKFLCPDAILFPDALTLCSFPQGDRPSFKLVRTRCKAQHIHGAEQPPTAKNNFWALQVSWNLRLNNINMSARWHNLILTDYSLRSQDLSTCQLQWRHGAPSSLRRHQTWRRCSQDDLDGLRVVTQELIEPATNSTA